jgi:recombination protein U
VVVSVAKNKGKIFEEDFKTSIPEYCFIQRLYDPPQSFVQSADTRFSNKNMCDYIAFDTRSKLLYLLELKTTMYKSIAFEDINSDNPTNRMIHKHQILGLNKHADLDGVIPCFILNFRNEDTKDQRTYFIHIKDFMKMINSINKKSFNEMDLILNGAIKIHGLRKRTRYAWDINEFLCNYGLAYANK